MQFYAHLKNRKLRGLPVQGVYKLWIPSVQLEIGGLVGSERPLNGEMRFSLIRWLPTTYNFRVHKCAKNITKSFILSHTRFKTAYCGYLVDRVNCVHTLIRLVLEWERTRQSLWRHKCVISAQYEPWANRQSKHPRMRRSAPIQVNWWAFYMRNTDRLVAVS